MFGTVRTLMRLPQQLGEALQAATDTARSVDRTVRETLAALRDVASDLERVRSTVEPQHRAGGGDRERPPRARRGGRADPLPTIEPQHLRVEEIQHAVARLEDRLAELQQALQTVEGTVEEATDRLPDPDAPGPFARARDTITGRS